MAVRKKSKKKKASKRVKSTGSYGLEDDEYAFIKEEEKEDTGQSGEKGSFMSLGDHLEELRKRLFAMMVVLTIFALVASLFLTEIHELLMGPFLKVVKQKFPDGLPLFMRNVTGAFIIRIKLAVSTGFSLALPILISIIWGFVTPAVSRRTSWVGHLAVAISSGLFWLGMFICWRFIFPVALQFLLLESLLPHVNPQLTVEDYYSFLFWIHIGTGLGFQLPLIIVVLGSLGILTINWHKKFWKGIIVSIFVFGAIVTPPDPVTQLILASSLSALYGISILIVWLIERARGKKDLN